MKQQIEPWVIHNILDKISNCYTLSHSFKWNTNIRRFMKNSERCTTNTTWYLICSMKNATSDKQQDAEPKETTTKKTQGKSIWFCKSLTKDTSVWFRHRCVPSPFYCVFPITRMFPISPITCSRSMCDHNPCNHMFSIHYVFPTRSIMGSR